MTRGVAAGHQRERAVGAHLRKQGWLLGSRRHEPGPGDWLAYKLHTAMLVEVKSTAGGPWETYGPKERAELDAEAIRVAAIPVIAYWPARGGLRMIFRSDWPEYKKGKR